MSFIWWTIWLSNVCKMFVHCLISLPDPFPAVVLRQCRNCLTFLWTKFSLLCRLAGLARVGSFVFMISLSLWHLVTASTCISYYFLWLLSRIPPPPGSHIKNIGLKLSGLAVVLLGWLGDDLFPLCLSSVGQCFVNNIISF